MKTVYYFDCPQCKRQSDAYTEIPGVVFCAKCDFPIIDTWHMVDILDQDDIDVDTDDPALDENGDYEDDPVYQEYLSELEAGLDGDFMDDPNEGELP